MLVGLLFLLFNVCVLHSNSLDYYELELDLGQKFSLRDDIFFSERDVRFGNEVFVRLQDKRDDDFLYKDIQENEVLNVEKSTESNWGKRAFRFSSISVGTFPIALLVSLFFFDLSYYFSNGMDTKYLPYPFSGGFKLSRDETFKKYMITASAGLALSLIIALVDWVIY
ncbi:hypothetical protein LKV13_00090 [Borrelia sp. BU AG58]|uniref:hypothetical protein n=1 Tax=Borrelia sp. BU AG58 TaxID=2887345 RepID=UPI001E37E39D|nr:hypothetical protein [Borrelia sp. BU AG58]UER67243.1 hypothetical protein LKV13_00090 [Borrelia sp. BU AG58]